MAFKATILYIEDDANSQTLISRILTHAGYRVLIASRALEGIDMARKHQPDLILTDINLPDLSGREITVRLRHDPRLAQVPIVAVTAQSHAFEREKTFVAGITGYLTKPVDVTTLTATIERYLTGYKDEIDPETLDDARIAYNRELVERLEANVRDLEARNRDLRRIDQLKDDFIQLTAHELRTPLTTVYGYSHLVQSSPAIQHIMRQDTDVKASLSGLFESIERLHTVIDEIVIVSRIASGRVDLRPGPLQFGALMQTIIDDYRVILQQRSQTLHYTPDHWDTEFVADRDLLELALSNLLGNAIKYTPDGGTITIRVQRKDDAHIVVSVRDSGIGIDPRDQPYIFDRFYTTGDTQLHTTSKTAFRGGGLGLGLAICRGIIEAHAGQIWVESEGCDPQRMPGSTFFIELPLEQPSNGIANAP